MGRYPAVSVAIACCLGIIADRFLTIDMSVLMVAAFGAVCVWFAVRLASGRASAVVLLSLCALLAAVHHHQWWYSIPDNDISRLLGQEHLPVQLRGTVASRPDIVPAGAVLQPSYRDDDLTRLEMICHSARIRDEWMPITGRIRVAVRGRADSVYSGDEVQMSGWLSPLPQVRNPGGLKFADMMRRRKIRATLSVRDPDLIQLRESRSTWLTRLRQHVRARCESVLEQGLSDDTRAIGMAMLLGSRSRIDPEVRSAFVKSGTLHVLAISGLHIGILALLILGVARVCMLSDHETFVALVICLSCYLAIADLRPPMVRAFILIVAWCASRLVRRASSSPNNLAVAAIIILAMNPTDLFDTGAQLSFLAVAAIYWLSATTARFRQAPDVAAEPNSARAKAVMRPDWMNLLLEWIRIPIQMWIVSAVIWLLGVPLVAYTWHVIPVIGVLINSILVIPVLAMALWSGFLALVAGSIVPSAAVPFVWILDWVLWLLLQIVDCAVCAPFGHFHVPSPPLWWLWLFYLFAAIAMLMTLWRRRSQLFWAGVSLWTIFGFVLGMQSQPPDGLKCTVFSMGHGLSVLVETPAGHSLLYDAGSQFGGEAAARVIEGALWKKRRTSIDALVISHADADHYGGVRPLLRSIPARDVYVSRHFSDESQSETVKTLEFAAYCGAEIHEVTRGDEILLDSDVSIRVIHPVADHHYADNGASIVLDITWQGRRILLTGDLRDRGLTEVLKLEPRRVDFLLAPHHGDPVSNSSELAEWAQPGLVVTSSRRGVDLPHLRMTYGTGANVLSTADVGAVEFQIGRDGEVSHSSILKRLH